jgi:nucleoside-diphosphate-sugar epimerase
MSDAPWVLFGCGYTATRLARRLLAGKAQVIATRLTSAGAAVTAAALGPSVKVVVADLQARDSLAALIPPGAIVVHSVPPVGPEGAELAEEVLVSAAAAAGARRLVYISSSGVYRPAHGAWIDEDFPTEPAGALGRRRLAAETALLAATRRRGLEMIALRAVAIYGPRRGVHARIAAGTYRVVGDGSSFISRVHVDDLGSAILGAALAGRPPRIIYNVADDQPTTAREHADSVAALLGLPPPPSVSPEELSADARDLLGGDRRVSNRRLVEELEVRLAYPTWRDGVAQALAEEAAIAAPVAI